MHCFYNIWFKLDYRKSRIYKTYFIKGEFIFDIFYSKISLITQSIRHVFKLKFSKIKVNQCLWLVTNHHKFINLLLFLPRKNVIIV